MSKKFDDFYQQHQFQTLLIADQLDKNFKKALATLFCANTIVKYSNNTNNTIENDIVDANNAIENDKNIMDMQNYMKNDKSV